MKIARAADLFKNARLAANALMRRKTLSVPNLLPLLREAAATLGGQYKDAHAAPIDHMLLRSAFDGSGSALDILRRVATELCAQHNTTVSRTVYNMLPRAGILFKKLAKDSTPRNIAQHHAALSCEVFLVLSVLLG